MLGHLVIIIQINTAHVLTSPPIPLAQKRSVLFECFRWLVGWLVVFNVPSISEVI